MGVETYHPSYSKKIARWRKQRHAYEGEDSIKATATSYLDRPGGFLDPDWQRYVRRAKWYGATRRTVSGLVGAVMQKPIVVEAPSSYENAKENITLSGVSIEGLATMCLRENLLLGRYGMMLDFSPELNRPYWSGFPTECIINWRTVTQNGEERLVLLVTHELFEDPDNDFFELTLRDRYRVSYLNAEGRLQVDIYEEHRRDHAGLFIVESLLPERRGQALDFIPFQFFGTEDLTSNVVHGPLDDLVDVNYAYFRHSADYEHGLFLTGIPTPVITGHSNTDEILRIGSLTAWVLPDPQAKAYLLEYQGSGLQSHERAMENDKMEMATLGARLLEAMPDVSETLGAVQLRHSGDTGSLKSLVGLVSDGLSNVLRWHHWWAGDTERVDDPDITLELNTDLAAAPLAAQDMQALMQVWQGGGISQETFLYNLQQGERLPPGLSIEDEMRRIETAAPARIPFDDTEEDAA